MAKEKNIFSIWQICNLCLGFTGLQIIFGLQKANMSFIYEYLGAGVDKIPILWLAAPLAGMIIQPIIGYFSDNTHNKLGRRRPYIFIGAIICTSFTFVMPFSHSLWTAVIFLFITSLALNACLVPYNAFVADSLRNQQLTLGFSFQAVFSSLGAIIASILPWALEHFFHITSMPCVTNLAKKMSQMPHFLIGLLHMPHICLPKLVEQTFMLGALLAILTILWSIFSTKEKPLTKVVQKQIDAEQKIKFKQKLADFLHFFIHMPKTMRQLALVQFSSWLGSVILSIYLPIAIAHEIFHATQGTPAYLSGLEWAGVCLAVWNIAAFVFALLIARIARKITNKYTYVLALTLAALSILSFHLIQNKYLLLLVMIGAGIGYASMLAIPFALLAKTVSENRGVYMGIFNIFITAPRILASICGGFIMVHFLENNLQKVIILAGFFLFFAAILMLRVKEPT